MRTPTTSQALGILVALYLTLLLAQFDLSFFKTKSLDSYEQVDYGTVIGIDFGLKHSRVGVVREGKFEIILDQQGQSLVPSVVSFTGDGLDFVGHESQEQALPNPKNTIFDIKHLIGGNFSDPATQKKIEELPYDVVEKTDSNGTLEIKIQSDSGEMTFSPEHIASTILTKLKQMAEIHLNSTIKSAVVTVPTYFSDSQRQAVKAAGRLARLNTLHTINESTAAAIAHRLDLWERWEGDLDPDFFASGKLEFNFVIYDVQETESDLTLLNSDHGLFEVKGTVHRDSVGGSCPVYINALRYLHTIMQTQLGSLGKIGIGSWRDLLQDIEQLLTDARLNKEEIHGILVTGNPSLAADAQRVLGACFNHKKLITSSEIPINQAIGQRLIANKNRLMGTLELTGLSPRPRGVPDIEVSLEVDANRIMRAIAREVRSKDERETGFVLRAMQSLYTRDIVRALYEDAEKFRGEDLPFLEDLPQTNEDEYDDEREVCGIVVK
ncbi:Hsp70 protein-domain-containing protein [Rhexocercosporidium sp. MPI-PUGE-AT-0058]|nr:Hsp70 protein-domain-containing protein [Rhexocercosporidium sp. MPI-PUGE-AT-0058]